MRMTVRNTVVQARMTPNEALDLIAKLAAAVGVANRGRVGTAEVPMPVSVDSEDHDRPGLVGFVVEPQGGQS